MSFWDKQFNVIVRESRESQIKHLILKSLIMLAIKIKYSKFLRYQLVFSEFEIENKDGETNIVDVYHQDKKSKAIYCYEIQRVINQDYFKSKEKFYKTCAPYGFDSVDYVIVNLKDAPSEVDKLWEWVNKLVV